MHFHLSSLGNIWVPFFCVLLAGCAPQIEPETSPAPVRPDSQISPEESVSSSTEETSINSSRPMPVNPAVDQAASSELDWSGRYKELFDYYYPLFPEPPTGRKVKLRAASGQLAEGFVRSLTPERMVFDLGDRQVTLTPEQLHSSSAYRYFPDAFAAYHARKQAKREYERWQKTAGLSPQSRHTSVDANPSGSASPRPTPWRIPPQSDDPMFPIEPYK